MPFGGETEHFSGRIGALRWSILVGKQKHNVQMPSLNPNPKMTLFSREKQKTLNGLNWSTLFCVFNI